MNSHGEAFRETVSRVLTVWAEVLPLMERGPGPELEKAKRTLQDALFHLREALVPRGDPLFGQIGQNRRAFQILALAGELLIWRGWPRRGAEVVLMTQAAEMAAQMLNEGV